MIKNEIVNGFHFYYYADSDWQKPVITEYQSFLLFYKHKNIPNNYLAFPWANLIDRKIKNIYKVTDYLNKFRINCSSCFTICQHINFRKYIVLMKRIGITHIFTCHKSKTDFLLEKKFNIKISAFSIYPAQNNENSDKIKNISNRKYLASFIGQYVKHIYMSDVRLKIFNILDKNPDCYIVRRNQWHYDGVVYKGAKETNKNYENDFKNNLMESKFSLCPSGTGPNSIRISESMSFGSIPVILANSLILPEIPQINYNDIFVFFSENNILNLYGYLKHLECNLEKLNEMSRKNVEIYNTYFAPDKIINTVLVFYGKDIV